MEGGKAKRLAPNGKTAWGIEETWSGARWCCTLMGSPSAAAPMAAGKPEERRRIGRQATGPERKRETEKRARERGVRRVPQSAS